VNFIREKKQEYIMEFNARERLSEIAEEIGGESVLREQMRDSGYKNWSTATFYPVVAWFPQYMTEPDILGIAVRDGFSFKVLYGCLTTPHEGIDEWFKYVSLHDEYVSITEALLDHHKAFIATESDMEDVEESSWAEMGEEVIQGLRPTKFDVHDDDFLIQGEYVFNFPLGDNSTLDALKTLLDSIKELGIGQGLSTNEFSRYGGESEIVASTSEEYSEDFKNDWA